MRDLYLGVVYQHLSLIVKLYERYADKQPVMLFDIQEQRIYAMPYAEYRADLSKRSQASLKKQYERAIADGEIVVFVRDDERKSWCRIACRCNFKLRDLAQLLTHLQQRLRGGRGARELLLQIVGDTSTRSHASRAAFDRRGLL
jgi:hypothetical protein